jgi:hypothetical protein
MADKESIMLLEPLDPKKLLPSENRMFYAIVTIIIAMGIVITSFVGWVIYRIVERYL